MEYEQRANRILSCKSKNYEKLLLFLSFNFFNFQFFNKYLKISESLKSLKLIHLIEFEIYQMSERLLLMIFKNYKNKHLNNSRSLSVSCRIPRTASGGKNICCSICRTQLSVKLLTTDNKTWNFDK